MKIWEQKKLFWYSLPYKITIQIHIFTYNYVAGPNKVWKTFGLSWAMAVLSSVFYYQDAAISTHLTTCFVHNVMII